MKSGATCCALAGSLALWMAVSSAGCAGRESTDPGVWNDTEDRVLAITYPWLFFHDWTGRIDSSGYTQLEREKIAAAGVGMWTMFRVLRDHGAGQIYAIKEINPDFISTCYYPVMSHPAQEPSIADGIERRFWEIFRDHPALHLDGARVLTWPPPSDGPPAAYWHSTLPATHGKAYNRDLLVELLDAMEEYFRLYPGICQGIYFDFHTVDGPYVFPAERDAHGDVDMDQDGVGFNEDPEEQVSWIEWERAFSQGLIERFGSNFLQISNGRAVHPGFADADETLGRLVTGAVFEVFPYTVWNYDMSRAMDQVYQAYSAGWYRRVFGENWILLHQIGLSDDLWHDMCRIGSMVFTTPYFFTATDSASVVFEDPHGIVAGAPTGDLVVRSEGDLTIYERAFENGTARITLNTTLETVAPEWISP